MKSKDCQCSKYDEYNCSYLLIKASKKGHVDCIQNLYDNCDDFDVNCRDYMGNNALHYASIGGYLECIKLLIEFGVDIYCEANVCGSTSLIFASYYGHLDCIQYLCEYSDSLGDLNNYISLSSKLFVSATSCAYQKGHYDCVEYLNNVKNNGITFTKFAGKIN